VPLGAPVFTAKLQNFADFLDSFDESTLPAAQRLVPPAAPLAARVFSPMTYEEHLVSYNTEARADHSTRYRNITPFDMLAMAEDAHCWNIEEAVGVRWKAGAVQVACRYPGFALPEWIAFHLVKATWQFRTFQYTYGARVDEVLYGGGARRAWCLPGVDADSEDVPVTPALVAAKAQLDAFQKRYLEERAAGIVHPSTKPPHKNAKKKKKVVEEEDDPEDSSDDEDEPSGGAAGDDAADDDAADMDDDAAPDDAADDAPDDAPDDDVADEAD
jgi:hypothetical protein